VRGVKPTRKISIGIIVPTVELSNSLTPTLLHNLSGIGGSAWPDRLSFMFRREIEVVSHLLGKAQEFIASAKQAEQLLYEKRLSKILENMDRGIFTSEDAMDFIKMRLRGVDSPKIKEIWLKYNEGLLPPAYPPFSFEILEILEKERRPLSYRKLLSKVEKVYGMRLDGYKKLDFRDSLDRLVNPRSTGRPLVKKIGRIFSKYMLTEYGEIAYVLLKDSMEKVISLRG
jgi:hypothetical protein